MTAPHYPETRRGDVVETLFGEKIADPYRWLENDVRNDPEVADWVARAEPGDRRYLARCRRATGSSGGSARCIDYERFRLPVKRGRPLFLHAQYGPAEPGAAVCPRRLRRQAAAADRSQHLGRATARPR